MKRDLRERRMERRIVELLLQGKTHRSICRELKVGDRRVRRVRELASACGYLRNGCSAILPPPFPYALFPEPQAPQNLFISDPDRELGLLKTWIIERLELGWRPVTVWEELPVKVARSSFYRFLDRHKLGRVGEKARVIPEIIHSPGEALILDWGKLRAVKDPETGKSKILWAFVGVLGFSRYMMVRLVWTNDVGTTVSAIESMLSEIGGLPSRITSDNPKCFAIEASKYEPLFNPIFERWAAHNGVTIECLPPGDPEKKGKVERLMPFVRRLYEAHGSDWFGLEESQEYIDRKVGLANQRKHGTTQLKPVEVFETTERVALKSLPALAYEVEEFHSGPVRRDGFVRFRNKYYCAGEQYVGCEVVVIGDKTQVSIYCEGKLLEVHDRITNPHISKAIKPHQMKPHERVMQDSAFYIKRAEKIGPFTAELITQILSQGHGFVDTRKVWGILSLDKKHSHIEVERACKLAYEMGSFSYRTVEQMVRLTKGSPTAPSKRTNTDREPKSQVANKFVRPMAVYKQLLLPLTGGVSHESPNPTGTVANIETHGGGRRTH